MKTKRFVAIVSIVLSFLILCGSFGSSKKIKAGDEALKKRDYEQAIKNYKAAGKEGEEKVAEVYTKQLLWVYKNEKFYVVRETIEELHQNEKDKELLTKGILGFVDVIKEEIEKGTNKDLSKATQAEFLLDILDMIQDQSLEKIEKIRKEMQDLIFNEELMQAIQHADNTWSKDADWEEALDLCRNAEEGSLGHLLLTTYERIQQRADLEAAKETKKLVDNNIDKIRFWKFATKDYTAESLNGTLEYMLAGQYIKGYYENEKTPEPNLTEIIDPNQVAILMGIDPKEEAYTLSRSMVEELKKNCGKDAAGKILIVHDRAIYDSKERTMDVVGHWMRKLPDSYKPTTAESVKYLIYVKSDYTKGGTYSGGTKQIIEKTALTVYDTENGRTIYTKTVNGKRSDVMNYTGIKPVYYSAESPDMAKAFSEAMNKIANQK